MNIISIIINNIKLKKFPKIQSEIASLPFRIFFMERKFKNNKPFSGCCF